MLQIDSSVTPSQLVSNINRLFELSAEKILSIENTWESNRGTPVFTVDGKYTVRGWTGSGQQSTAASGSESPATAMISSIARRTDPGSASWSVPRSNR